MPLDDDMEHIENCATKLCIENDIREHVEELTCTMFYRHKKKSIGAKKKTRVWRPFYTTIMGPWLLLNQ